VVFLILAAVWAAILAPSLVRRGLERRRENSIGDFRRHLRVLQRTGPIDVRPAFRLHHGGARQGGAPGGSTEPPFRLPPPVASRHGLVLVRPGDDTRSLAPKTTRVDPFFRPGACKRRRDVVCSLMVVILGTGLLGAIPTLRPALAVTAATFMVTVAYLVTLVRMRARAVERARKLRYLPEQTEPEPAFVILRSAAR
jgi:hypothetical protein